MADDDPPPGFTLYEEPPDVPPAGFIPYTEPPPPVPGVDPLSGSGAWGLPPPAPRGPPAALRPGAMVPPIREQMRSQQPDPNFFGQADMTPPPEEEFDIAQGRSVPYQPPAPDPRAVTRDIIQEQEPVNPDTGIRRDRNVPQPTDFRAREWMTDDQGNYVPRPPPPRDAPPPGIGGLLGGRTPPSPDQGLWGAGRTPSQGGGGQGTVMPGAGEETALDDYGRPFTFRPPSGQVAAPTFSRDAQGNVRQDTPGTFIPPPGLLPTEAGPAAERAREQTRQNWLRERGREAVQSEVRVDPLATARAGGYQDPDARTGLRPVPGQRTGRETPSPEGVGDWVLQLGGLLGRGMLIDAGTESLRPFEARQDQVNLLRRSLAAAGTTINRMDAAQLADLVEFARTGLPPAEASVFRRDVQDLREGAITPQEFTNRLYELANTSNWVRTVRQAAQRGIEAVLPGASPEAQASFLGQMAEGAGTTVGALLISRLPAGAWINALSFMAQGEASQLQDAIQAGATNDQINSLFMERGGLAAWGGLSEMAELEVLMRAVERNPGAFGFVMASARNMIRNGAAESAQEAFQGVLQNLEAGRVYDPNRNMWVSVSENAEVAAAIGGLFGIFSTAWSPVRGARARTAGGGTGTQTAPPPPPPAAPPGGGGTAPPPGGATVPPPSPPGTGGGAATPPGVPAGAVPGGTLLGEEPPTDETTVPPPPPPPTLPPTRGEGGVGTGEAPPPTTAEGEEGTGEPPPGTGITPPVIPTEGVGEGEGGVPPPSLEQQPWDGSPVEQAASQPNATVEEVEAAGAAAAATAGLPPVGTPVVYNGPDGTEWRGTVVSYGVVQGLGTPQQHVDGSRMQIRLDDGTIVAPMVDQARPRAAAIAGPKATPEIGKIPSPATGGITQIPSYGDASAAAKASGGSQMDVIRAMRRVTGRQGAEWNTLTDDQKRQVVRDLGGTVEGPAPQPTEATPPQSVPGQATKFGRFVSQDEGDIGFRARSEEIQEAVARDQVRPTPQAVAAHYGVDIQHARDLLNWLSMSPGSGITRMGQWPFKYRRTGDRFRNREGVEAMKNRRAMEAQANAWGLEYTGETTDRELENLLNDHEAEVDREERLAIELENELRAEDPDGDTEIPFDVEDETEGVRPEQPGAPPKTGDVGETDAGEGRPDTEDQTTGEGAGAVGKPPGEAPKKPESGGPRPGKPGGETGRPKRPQPAPDVDTGGGPDITKQADYGSKNKLVTKERYEEAIKKLREKMRGQLPSGADPEIFAEGTLAAVYHIEAGARKFVDFSKAMIETLGEQIRPFLRAWYEGARHYPGVDAIGMTSSMELDRQAVEQKAGEEAPTRDKPNLDWLLDRTMKFASGMSRINDLIAGASAVSGQRGHGIGVDVGQLSERAINVLGDEIINGHTLVFVDSGAFSLFRKKLRNADVGKVEYGEEVEALDFDAIFRRYDDLMDAMAAENPAEETDYPRPLLVMPDVVGDQAASLELVKKYAHRIGIEAIFNNALPIVPIQRGELSLVEAYDRIVELLGTDKFITGIPANEKAVPLDELTRFLERAKPYGVHFLGAVSNKRLAPKLQAILDSGHIPNHISADANVLRSALYGKGTGDRAEDIKKALRPEDEGAAPASNVVKLAHRIALLIKDRESVTREQLEILATRVFGGTRAEGKWTPRDAYDALELAVNLHLAERPKQFDPRAVTRSASATLAAITKIINSLPTQTVRTEEQVSHQQFSTPPDYAFVIARIAGIREGEVVLEPSAGTGSLVVAAKNSGGQVIANEIADRRVETLNAIPGIRVQQDDAAQLHNTLDVQPTVVIMNPPFSSTAGRTDTKDLMVGANHIEAALKALAPGGRLVAIVGRGMDFTAPTFRDWWGRIRQEYAVRANVAVNGEVYRKYGTSFGTRVLVIDKVAPDRDTQSLTTAVQGTAQSLDDLLTILEPVRGTRAPSAEQTSPEPGGKKPTGSDARPDLGGGPRPPVHPPTGGLGTGGKTPRPGGPQGGTPQPGEHDIDTGEPGAGGTTTVPGGPGGAGSTGGTGAVSGKPEGGGTSGPRVGSDPTTTHSPLTEPADAPVDQITIADATGTPDKQGELTTDIFEEYHPQRVTIPGAKPHPTALVQSAAMAGVLPPAATYTPNLPQHLIDNGTLSAPQVEAIIYAGQAHETDLPAGEGETATRRGYFIGDGTGVGKGRTIAGIILDNFRRQRRKAVWISKNKKLIKDAKRDWSALEGSLEDVHDLGKHKLGGKIKAEKGILFATYDTLPKLAQGAKAQRQQTRGRGPALSSYGLNSRIGQLVEWLGADFDGVIVFDESHMMASATPTRTTFGTQEASDRAIAGIELQNAFPRARVVYASATGATEVSNLAYTDRLGLWGRGTAFADLNDFINKISQGGIAGMELIARDMKAMGAYIARNLSFNGVEQDRLEHQLTDVQREMYDTMAEGWQVTLRDIERALNLTSANPNRGVDRNQRKQALGAYWSANQRFWNQILTAMKIPSLVAAIEEDIKNGHQVVIQLVNTDEAATTRAVKKLTEDETLDDLDITPRDILIQMIRRSFPTQQMESVTDPNTGNVTTRPAVQTKPQLDANGKQVYDANGQPVFIQEPVENREAVALREALIERISMIQVPQGALDQLLEHFGADKMAEVTGRTKRYVRAKHPKTGVIQRMEQKRGDRVALGEAAEFQDGLRRILAFSDAGGTGASYHADNASKSKGRRRVHYILQAGWRADNATQGVGRSHRANQASAPIVKLVSTNLKGEKRFISSIARRIQQLGALTKGQREASEQGMFSARDNLENTQARQALERLWHDLRTGGVQGVAPQAFEQQTGLNLSQDAPEITQFLNRILTLKVDVQNAVFEAFQIRLDIAIEVARQTGELDIGLETIAADKIEKLEDRVVFTEERTKAETRYARFKLYFKNQARDFAKTREQIGADLVKYVISPKAKHVYAVMNTHPRTDTATGAVVGRYRLVGATDIDYMDIEKVEKWQTITEDQARTGWDENVRTMPEYQEEEVHLITGAILPVWDRLPDKYGRVLRLQTDAGERFLGRKVGATEIDKTLQQLGAGQSAEAKVMTPAELARDILEKGRVATLVNGWTLRRSRIGGNPRIEIAGIQTPGQANEAKRFHAIVEIVNGRSRFFMPTDENLSHYFDWLIREKPVASLHDGAAPQTSMESPLPEPIQGATPLDLPDQTIVEIGENIKAIYKKDPELLKNREDWLEYIKPIIARLVGQRSADMLTVPNILARVILDQQGKQTAQGTEILGVVTPVYFDDFLVDWLMAVSVHSDNPIQTARHEAIHLARRLGIISNEQWEVLRAAALRKDRNGKDWLDHHKVRTRWKDHPGYSEESLIEEAVAEEFANWTGKGQPVEQYTAAKKAHAAFVRFIRMLRAAMRQFLGLHPNARTLFEQLEKGMLLEQAEAEGRYGIYRVINEGRSIAKQPVDVGQFDWDGEDSGIPDDDFKYGYQEQPKPGDTQINIPGTEEISQKEQAERRMAERGIKKQRGKTAKGDLEALPLFDTETKKQGSLFQPRTDSTGTITIPRQLTAAPLTPDELERLRGDQELVRLLEGRLKEPNLEQRHIETIQSGLAEARGRIAALRTIEAKQKERIAAGPPPVFTSALTRAAEMLKTVKGTAQQILGMLKATPGVKPAEIEWSGVEEWLKSLTPADANKPVQITREQVVDFLREAEVQLEETMLGGEAPLAAIEAIEAWGRANPGNTVFNFMDVHSAARGRGEAIERLEAAGVPSELLQPIYDNIGEGATQYGAGANVLPGAENYREMLIRLPAPSWWTEGRRDAPSDEAAAKVYTAQHFRGQRPNILVHIRFNTRVDINGKRTLHIEEIQSDWHQKGRKKGYRDSVRRTYTRAELTNPTVKQDKTLSGWDVGSKRYRGYVTLPDGREVFLTAAYNEQETAEKHLKDWLHHIEHTGGWKAPLEREKVPEAPFKTTWHELAMKRMLRYAADQGFDQITWTTGEQQNERYDLRQAVEKIHTWKDHPTGDRVVTISTKGVGAGRLDKFSFSVEDNGNINIVTKGPQDWVGEHLSEVVGKELAEKIMSGQHQTIQGEGLEVGGKGMVGWYDKIIRDFMSNYGKKWGAKVGTTEIPREKIRYEIRNENGQLDARWFATLEEAQEAARASEERGYAGWPQGMKWTAQQKLTTYNTVHAMPITDTMRGTAAEPGPIAKEQPMFAPTGPNTPPVPSRTARQTAMARGATARPTLLDFIFRLPFQVTFMVDKQGNFRLGAGISSATRYMKNQFTFPNWFPGSAGMNSLMARTRIGLIDRYGVPEEFRQRGDEWRQEVAKLMAPGIEHVRWLSKQNITIEEARTLHKFLTGQLISNSEWSGFFDKYGARGEAIRAAIDDMGQQAVALGLISRESYERNRGTYMHRSYMKYESEAAGKPEGVISSRTQRARVRFMADEMKGRGLFFTTKFTRIMGEARAWWGERSPHELKGHKFVVLDLTRESQNAEVDVGQEPTNNIVRRVYWPAELPVPAFYGEHWLNRGTFEVRNVSHDGKDVVIWRDFTPEEREQMGEILDARYNIAKTFHLMGQDLATGRFFLDIANNDEWARHEVGADTWINASQYNAFTGESGGKQWVKVNEEEIPHTGGKKRWGALAGMFVRPEIWRDLHATQTQFDSNSFMSWWTPVMNQWKLNMTARNPTVHVNNVVSNVVLMDMHNIRFSTVLRALKSIITGDARWQRAVENGVFDGGWASHEMRREVLQPLLEDIQKQTLPSDAVIGPRGWSAKIAWMGRFINKLWTVVKWLDRGMVNLYQAEDNIFKLAAFMERERLKDSPGDAAVFAREAFIDYDIRAPWVQAARKTVLPFLSYTYRAIPMMANLIVNRPWKVMKYMAVWNVLNALAYLMWPGDEELERESLRREQQGYLWSLFAPIGNRMLRLWNDEHGRPMFLDLRNFVPGGNSLDTMQGHSVIPLLAWMNPGGPLMVVMELIFNRSAFTGQPIISERTATGRDRVLATADHVWKSWMPNAAWVPGSRSWERVERAMTGQRDRLGRPYSVGEALVNTMGIKLTPQDVAQGFHQQQQEIEREIREFNLQRRAATADWRQGRATQAQYQARLAEINARIGERSAELRRIGRLLQRTPPSTRIPFTPDYGLQN